MTVQLVSKWNNKSILHPYEDDVVPAWDEREIHNQKQCIALLMEVEKDMNCIWVIRFNLKITPITQALCKNNREYPYRDYPAFFPTYDHAAIYFSLAPQFREWPEDAKSVTFEPIRFTKPTRTALRARKKKSGESYGKT
jgi:hypothetical protein